MEAIKTDVHVEPTIETPWTTHADALAAWTIEQMANREDAYGEYTNRRALTCKTPITPAMLASHFRGEKVFGLHAISVTNTCKWMCIDIDCHADGDDPAATERYAQFLRAELCDMGLEPTLFSSDGRGSSHLFVHFEKPIEAEIVHAFGSKLLREFKPPEGVATEYFPKQLRIGANGFGSWVRLPGRHHKRSDHWHKAFVGNHWLNAEGTVRHILSITGIDPELIRAYVGTLPPKEGTRNNELFKEACDLNGRGFIKDEASAVLSPRFLDAGLERDEIEGTIASAYSKDRDPAHTSPTNSDSGKCLVWPPKTPACPDTTLGRVRPVSIHDLEDDEDVDYIWDGYLSPGHTTVFSGVWKGGKSTLIGYLLRLFGIGGELATKVHRAKALVISEETRSAWKARRVEIGITGEVDLICQPFMCRPSINQWIELLSQVASLVRTQKYDAVIIDTLTTIWPVCDENSAAMVTEALVPTRMVTRAGAAVMLVHHPRKGGGSEGEGIRGSGALAGFVDIILEMKRFDAQRSDDRRRTLTAYSRLPDTPGQIVVELGEFGYEVVGTKAEASQSDRLAVIAKMLPRGGDGITSKKVWKGWTLGTVVRPSERTVRRDLTYGASHGRWRVKGQGISKDPLRFSL